MKVSIQYCGVWNYYPKASSLKAEIEKSFPDIEVTLIEGSRGIFDVKADGQLIFSKYKSGRFPDHDEILNKL